MQKFLFLISSELIGRKLEYTILMALVICNEATIFLPDWDVF